MKNNKKLWLGIGCGVLLIALIVGVVLMAGGSDKNPNPTTPSSTPPSGNVIEPSGTEPNVTEPSHKDEPEVPTSPAVPEQPSDPVIEPTIPDEDPDAPNIPDDLDPDTDPTPSDPDTPPVVDPDPTPSDPIEPEKPDDGSDEGPEIVPSVPKDEHDDPFLPNPTYDFTGITPGNLTAEQWKSWDRAKRQAFFDTYDIANLSLDDKYNFYSIIQFGGLYDCGHKGHYCPSAECHDMIMADVAEGCPHCGGNDCAAFYARDELGFTEVNFDKCPQYDVTKDPVYYCQTCGLSLGGGNAQKGDECCHKYIADATCSWCGEPVKANQCHRCIKP